MGKKRSALREQLWPKIRPEEIWDRKKSKGFITIPRQMPYFLRAMDTLSSGRPLSQTYLALWCRGFDEGVVKLEHQDMAFESGFTGQRAVQTWRDRVRMLSELGFILTAEGASGPFSHALILDPFLVVKKLHAAGKIPKDIYNALYARSQAVGSQDMEQAADSSTQ